MSLRDKKLRVRHKKTGQIGTIIDELFYGTLWIIQWDGQTEQKTHQREEFDLLDKPS